MFDDNENKGSNAWRFREQVSHYTSFESQSSYLFWFVFAVNCLFVSVCWMLNHVHVIEIFPLRPKSPNFTHYHMMSNIDQNALCNRCWALLMPFGTVVCFASTGSTLAQQERADPGGIFQHSTRHHRHDDWSSQWTTPDASVDWSTSNHMQLLNISIQLPTTIINKFFTFVLLLPWLFLLCDRILQKLIKLCLLQPF